MTGAVGAEVGPGDGTWHDWILVQPTTTLSTAKRFDTREHPDPGLHPGLVLEYLPAPCGSNLCTATVNSTGTWAHVGMTGSCVIANNDLTLTGGPVPNQPGLFIYSKSLQPETPLGNGLLCIGGASQIVRLPVQVASNQAHQRTLDFDDLPSNGPILPGETWYFQLWYRDPAASPSRFSVTDAIEITFQ